MNRNDGALTDPSQFQAIPKQAVSRSKVSNYLSDKDLHRELIGLLPAAGQATRISPLPCSKELYPVGFRPINESGGLRTKAVCHYLLEKMRFAGVIQAYIVLRNGKWDIPAYPGDGTMLNMHLAYLMMGLPFGQPYTLDQAYPFVHDAVVAVGFPNIIFQPHDAFNQLFARQIVTDADVVLGLFHANRLQNSDMVDCAGNGRVRSITIKPAQTDLYYTWIIAVWTPVFTRFIHDYLIGLQCAGKHDGSCDENLEQRELFLGHVFQAAIDNNLYVEGVPFPDDDCLDIGTPEDLVKAAARWCNRNSRPPNLPQ